MGLVQDQEPTTIQFVILEENQVLPLKWYKPTYGSGHSWLIQAEGRSHCSGGQQAECHLYYDTQSQCGCLEKLSHQAFKAVKCIGFLQNNFTFNQCTDYIALQMGNNFHF